MSHEMPKPGPEHAVLARLSGHFRGDEVMMANGWCPEQMQSTGTIRARMLDGFFVISDYEQKIGDRVTFKGHGVYSWDPHRKCYRMYWFDSMGGPGGIADGQMSGDVLTFENTSPMGRHLYRYTFAADHTRYEMAVRPEGGEWMPLMDATYRPVASS